jgi:hypothetical protein
MHVSKARGCTEPAHENNESRAPTTSAKIQTVFNSPIRLNTWWDLEGLAGCMKGMKAAT